MPARIHFLFTCLLWRESPTLLGFKLWRLLSLQKLFSLTVSWSELSITFWCLLQASVLGGTEWVSSKATFLTCDFSRHNSVYPFQFSSCNTSQTLYLQHLWPLQLTMSIYGTSQYLMKISKLRVENNDNFYGYHQRVNRCLILHCFWHNQKELKTSERF